MGEKILWLVCLCRGVEEVGEAPPEEVVVLDCEAEGATKRRRANEEPGLTFESPEAGRRKGTPISTVVGQEREGKISQLTEVPQTSRLYTLLVLVLVVVFIYPTQIHLDVLSISIRHVRARHARFPIQRTGETTILWLGIRRWRWGSLLSSSLR
jgi:hypothetical protein